MNRWAGPAAAILLLLVAVDGKAEEAASPFTAAQAKQGAELYAARCAACHGPAMTGIDDAPPLTGARFSAKWTGQPLAALFTKIAVTMPQDEPGALHPDQAAALVAAILAANGYTPGAMFLPAGAQKLGAIRIGPAAQRDRHHP